MASNTDICLTERQGSGAGTLSGQYEQTFLEKIPKKIVC